MCCIFSLRNGEHWEFAHSAVRNATRRGETYGTVPRTTKGAAKEGVALCVVSLSLVCQHFLPTNMQICYINLSTPFSQTVGGELFLQVSLHASLWSVIADRNRHAHTI